MSGAGAPSSGTNLSGFDALTKDPVAQSYWVKRLVAFVIDAIIVAFALLVITVLSALPFLFVTGPSAFFAVIGGVYSVVSGVLLFLYFLFAEMWMGSSIGKWLIGLKVVTDAGSRPLPGESALRNISKIYWLLLLLDVIIGLATSKQYTKKYSDIYAKTSVVPV